MEQTPLYEWVPVRCPWCGEVVEVRIEGDLSGSWVQDCEVCCRPWRVRLLRDEWGDPELQVEPG